MPSIPARPPAFSLLVGVLAALGLLAAGGLAGATQVGFMAPVEESLAGHAIVRMTDGRELTGTLGSFVYGAEGINRMTLKGDDGTKARLKSDDVERLTVHLGKLAQLEMASEAGSTLSKVLTAGDDDLFRFDEAIFDQVAWPHADRPTLLQLVNPGFASRLRVYYIRTAKSGKLSLLNVAISGDESNAFVVIKDGGAPFEVRKDRYREQDFKRVFGDCPRVMAEVPAADRDFRRFAGHVLLYERLCPEPAGD